MVTGLDRHPRFERLAKYLAGKAPAGKLPGRQHIDPIEIPDLLPFLMLVDVVPQQGGPLRYRMRLVGTQVVAIHGSEITGQLIEEALPTDEGEAIRQGYDDMIHTKQPQYRSGVVALPERKHVSYERVAFPLAADGEHVDMLIFVFASRSPFLLSARSIHE